MRFPLAAALLCLARCTPAVGTAPLDSAFDRFYNFDFPGAHQALNGYVGEHPQDPLGHMVRGAVYLFTELDRLRILEAEFFIDDDKFVATKKLKPDPAIRGRFFAAIDQGRRLASQRLAVEPRDRNALLSMCIGHGLAADYSSLIEKRHWTGLGIAKQSQVYAVRLLKADPSAYDAYLTAGVHEYLLGSIPFFLRWFIRFEQVQGSKQQAVRNLMLVVRSGHYFRPFAKIALAIIYLRENRAADCRRLLIELNQEFPENPLFRKELGKITEYLRKSGSRP